MRSLAAVLIFLMFCSLAAGAWDLNGYLENDLIAAVKRDRTATSGDLVRLRLKLDQKWPTLALHLEPRYYGFLKSENFPLAGITDIDRLVWDRYYAKFYLPALSVTAGKQRIAWGTSYIWNPTDIFNPYVLAFAVKEEEESNVEAVRIEVPWGAAGGLDGYVLTGAELRNANKGIRAKGNAGLFDFSASYVDLGGTASQIGADFSGDIFKDVGVRGEVAFHYPTGGSSYHQMVLGGDYTLDNGVGVNLEYFDNGQMGTDYLFVGLNKILDEITQIKGSLLINLKDQSFLVYPAYTRNIGQFLDLSVEGMLTGGVEGSEFYPTDQQDPTGLTGSKLLLIRLIYNF